MSTVDVALTRWPDLASRRLAGSVVAANDELYAERENLIRDQPPTHDPTAFGHKGKVYDGWETRRRRSAGHDWVIVRLGVPGIVHSVTLDTSYFRGNYPPEISVEGACVDGYPDVDELQDVPWHALVPRSSAKGDTCNTYPVTDPHRWTHVRLCIYPDGGVARLRVHGEPVPDPRFLAGTVDLAAAENGGRLIDCSNDFYSSPTNLIQPGRARVMADGWENSRRRDGGNDHATFALVGVGVVRHVELDTSYFVGNSPGWARLSGWTQPVGRPDMTTAGLGPAGSEAVVVARTPMLPDCRHRYLSATAEPVDRVRLDVYPDGGLSRLRIWGELTEPALESLWRRWHETRPV